jgi:hypothetical protein
VKATPSNSHQLALRAAMDRYIERHLLDGAVTLYDIAAAHGATCRAWSRSASTKVRQ